MKKFILLLAITNFITFTGNSQNTFKKIFQYGYVGTNVILKDSNYYIGDFGNNSEIIKLDLNGNIISDHIYYSLPGSSIGGFGQSSYFISDSNNLIFFCSGIDSFYRLCLSSYNTITNSFNWVTGFNINGNFDYMPHRVCINQGFLKSYFLSTFKWNSIVTHDKFVPLIIKTDSIGNLTNSYIVNNHFGIPKFTYQLTNSSYLTGINFLDSMGASLVRYDTSGIVLWAKTFFTSNSIIHSSVFNNDGTVTIIGSPDTTTNSTFRTPIFLLKIDTSGTVLWCKEFGDSTRSFYKNSRCQIKATKDGGYIITGATTNSLPHYYYADLIVIKTDVNGDTLWTRTHGEAYTMDIGDDIEQTPDGGYIVTGYSTSAQFQYGGNLVFKLDSLGMTSTHCQEFNTPFSVSNIVPYDSNITVTMTTDVITAMPSSVRDTSVYIPVKDGCLLAPVGINEPTFNSSLKLQAFPNPTLGNFNLKNGLSTPPLKTIIVYDMFGHEIFTKQNVKETEPALDLSKQAPGVYYVKVIQGQKVEVTKVVVE